MKKIKWGILGCGKIAGKFASDLRLLEDTELLAVASRDQQNVEKFGAEYGARFIYTSYEALINNDEVDVIYVATPHGLHYDHVMQCLRGGKAVLCEKAFALNLQQAGAMISLAKSKRVFLMEALWSKFIPSFRKMKALIEENRLGDIQNVLINFGFIPQPPIAQRIFDPALGGGTLLDIGIYNVFYALSVLGKPDHIEAHITRASTGVDEQCAVLFRYNNGVMAQLFSSYTSHLPTEANISGTKGRIRLTHRFYTPEALLELYTGRMDSRQVIEVPATQGWGYHYEASHVNDCLRKGLTESPVMTHADSLLLMETLDNIRHKSGIVYPADQVIEQADNH
ncbi:MAG: Gfo/Idh/MocA family oxidoreductase [Chitinophagaceae bacterium]|nr:Gfo/Idh/MocA family oxidoreductase [Chitinophagaceae bacterium]